MKESIFSLVAITLTNVITYFLGKVQGRKKTEAEVDVIELGNLKSIVDIYKGTFEDLKSEVHKLKNTCTTLAFDVHLSNEDRAKLSSEINELRIENIELKREILQLNQLITVLNNKE